MYHLIVYTQGSTFQEDDYLPLDCVDLSLSTTAAQTTPFLSSRARCDWAVCGRESATRGREYDYCSALNKATATTVYTAQGSSDCLTEPRPLFNVVDGECSESCREYGHDNHYLSPPLYEFQGTLSFDNRSEHHQHQHHQFSGHGSDRCLLLSVPVEPMPRVPRKSLLPPLQQGTATKQQSPNLVEELNSNSSFFVLNGKRKVYKDHSVESSKFTAHMGVKCCGCQLDIFSRQPKCLKQNRERNCFLKALLKLLVHAQRIKNACDLYHHGDKCVDSGSSSSSGGQGSGGSSSSSKKQQSGGSGGGSGGSGNRSGSSSSSSQRSGSGSSQRGRTGMGGRTHSGSSDSSDDNGDDDHNKRPRPQPNKEPKSKLDVSDDDDDEATDSADEGADEGADDTPRSMMVDVSPQSVQNDNGTSMSSQGGGVGEGGAKEQGSSNASSGGGGGVGSERRNLSNLAGLPLSSGGGSTSGAAGGSGRFSSVGTGGGTVESITCIAGGGGGRIGTSTLVASSQIGSPGDINVVGYGGPVLAAPEGDGLIAPNSTSIPGSELGTPTMDSPSPPHLGGRDTPGTPPPMSPEVAPTAQVRNIIHIIEQ